MLYSSHVIVRASTTTPYGFALAVDDGAQLRVVCVTTQNFDDVVRFADSRKHLPAYITGAALNNLLYRLFPPYPATLYSKPTVQTGLTPDIYIDFDVVRAILMMQSAGAELAQIKKYVEEIQAA